MMPIRTMANISEQLINNDIKDELPTFGQCCFLRKKSRRVHVLNVPAFSLLFGTRTPYKGKPLQGSSPILLYQPWLFLSFHKSNLSPLLLATIA